MAEENQIEMATAEPVAVKPSIKFNHEPELLMGLGIAGLLFSIGWGIKTTIAATRKCDEKKKREGKDKLTFKEVVKETWKMYLPVAASTVLSVPCIIVGNHVTSKRAAALAAAYSVSESALHAYTNKTKEIVGDVKEKTIRDAVSREQAQIAEPSKTQTKEVIVNDDAEQLFYEPLSDRYFKSTWAKVMQACNDLNEKTLGATVGAYSINDWYEMLGINTTKTGDMLGWCTTTFGGSRGLMRISLVPGITKDNKPCCAIQYDVMPYYVAEYMR